MKNQLTTEQVNFILDIGEKLMIDCQNPHQVDAGWKKFTEALDANTMKSRSSTPKFQDTTDDVYPTTPELIDDNCGGKE